jgi:hypothetical protein
MVLIIDSAGKIKKAYLTGGILLPGSGGGGVTSVTATTPLSSTGGATPDISITQATGATSGYLSAVDWTTFNSKQDGLTAGIGISLAGNIVTNTLPDQTVALTAGTGIGVAGTYPNFTISNTSPSSGGTVTSIDVDAGTGISVSPPGPITTSGTFTVTNTAPDQVVSLGTTGSGLAVTGTYPSFTLQNTLPDQTVALTAGTGIGITGTYPNFTITNSSPSSGGTVTAVTASAPMASTGGTAPNLSMPQSGAVQDGYLSSTDWNTFNSKQDALTLTTTGTSGAATLIGSTLNIPQYSGGGGASIVRLTGQTLTAASWTLVSGYYTYTFSNVNITVNTRVDFTPDNTSYLEVTTCGMQTQVTVAAGSCTFFSLFPPQTNITGEVTIFPTI